MEISRKITASQFAEEVGISYEDLMRALTRAELGKTGRKDELNAIRGSLVGLSYNPNNTVEISAVQNAVETLRGLSYLRS